MYTTYIMEHMCASWVDQRLYYKHICALTRQILTASRGKPNQIWIHRARTFVGTRKVYADRNNLYSEKEWMLYAPFYRLCFYVSIGYVSCG